MPRRIESLFLDGPAGRLEALLEEPEDREPVAAALLCHPHPNHGGTMHNKVVYRVARGLRKAGCVVLRFNFRGVNLSEGEYGHWTGEREDALAALAHLRPLYPKLPYLLAGFSFGSRIILQVGCPTSHAKLLLAVGFPTRYQDAHEFVSCTTPMHFISSTNDEYGPPAEIEKMVAGLSGPKQLTMVEAQDHFFRDALDSLEEQVTRAAQTALS